MLPIKLLKSKRGQIDAIAEGITGFVSWFFQTMPKPLLLFIFLFFILLVGNLIIPGLINMLGFHCDSGGTIWKASAINILGNAKLISGRPSGTQTIYKDIPGYCLKNREVFALYCTDCPFNNLTMTCTGDGNRLSSYPVLNPWWYCELHGCAPPEGYFYNMSASMYQCSDPACVNKTLTDYDTELYTIAGAAPFYSTSTKSYDFKKLIYLKCQRNNKVNIRLTFFGIDVFDYKLWLALFVLGAIVWFKINYMK